ncbi:hypothetical protein AC578_10145 [Pseudocercospora eumusae]|uniref:Uncharacterized protein n=1 Tax=Pseudocercospora eumusae TaxID=321146 RepID=A0A139HZ14_9PEZI|nr:hypothetical protein AC578_10145 [Pseudocercospora eumusae]
MSGGFASDDSHTIGVECKFKQNTQYMAKRQANHPRPALMKKRQIAPPDRWKMGPGSFALMMTGSLRTTKDYVHGVGRATLTHARCEAE